MTEPLTYLDGHCQHAPGTAETYHHLCPGEMTTQFGVRRVCVCPRHDRDSPTEGGLDGLVQSR